MKKLRLLVTPMCNRSCKGCCNSIWNLKELPTVNTYELNDYEEIMLTGGEPMLDPVHLLEVIQHIKDWCQHNGSSPFIYLYTAKSKSAMELLMVLQAIDGLTLSLHEQYDVPGFVKFQKLLRNYPELCEKGLRLNVIDHVNIEGIDTKHWDVRVLPWVAPQDCPLPADEDFKRWPTSPNLNQYPMYRLNYTGKV